ncbi:MAG TPA: alpha/beta hydrolase-fold protein [Acidobacteriota bacterium]|nr:alpha/beta hydrolase-fold protein [Acidobacteriota bacterium]
MIKKRCFVRWFGMAAALGVLGTHALAQAARPAISPVRIERIASARLGETREAWVSLPDRYDESGSAFPVLYMMDADFNFNSGVIGGLRQAALLGEMPDFIVVGIKNTDRSKDIFPEEITYADGSKDGGRADRYLDFIREELISFVEKRYRTEKLRVLYGTSNTGFTAVYGLLRDPGLADSVIAASATLRVRTFVPKRDQMIRDFKGGPRRLVLIMGERDYPTIISGNGELKEKIGTLAPEGLSCRLAVIGNGGHVPGDSLAKGLSILFEGWKIGLALNDKTFDEVRARAEARREKYGVSGPIPEEDLRDLGQTLAGEKKLDRAAEVLEYAVACYPRSPDAWIGLGDACRSLGRVEKARSCYLKAVELAPGRSDAAARLKELDGK